MENKTLWQLHNMLTILKSDFDGAGYNPEYAAKLLDSFDCVQNFILSEIRENEINGQSLFAE